MKIAAFVDDGLKNEEFYVSHIQTVRSVTGADAVAAVMAGDILHNGFLCPQSKESRAEKLTRAGADLVIESPVHGVILKPDTYAYVMTMLMQKLDCVDTLFMPCRRGDTEILNQAAWLMLRAPREYHQVLQKLRPGRELFDVIPEAVGRFVPGAEAAMKDPMNRFALDVKNAVTLSFSPVKVVLHEVDFGWDPEEISPETDARMGELLRERIQIRGTNGLMEIFGSTAGNVAQLQALTANTFTEFAQGLTCSDCSPLTARQFLLRILLDFRHITHSNYALQSYIPAVRLLRAGSAEAEAALIQGTGVPVLRGDVSLSGTESRAAALYKTALC